jgi:hypothetical protein
MAMHVDAVLIKEYENGYLYFAQERLIVTDKQHNELVSNDIIDLVEQIF